MQNWNTYFSPSYLFDKLPKQDNNLLIGLAIFFVILIIAGIIASIFLAKKAKKIPPYNIFKNYLSNLCLTIGIIGLILIFFRWQEIVYFSAPILILILLFALLVWIGYIIIYVKKRLSREIDNFYAEKRYHLYIPKSKK